jgi:hypothetical protein
MPRLPLTSRIAGGRREASRSSPMSHVVNIAKRFCGPPESGNGGYVCGLLAAHVAGDAEVTLRRPPPLERDLRLATTPEGGAVLRDGDDVVAEAVPSVLDVAVPPAFSFDDAQRAAPSARTLRAPEEHPFPSCFVCGPDRAPGDGMRLFPATIEGRDVVAAPWVPDASLPRAPGGDGDVIAGEMVWAALDCPSSFSMYLEPELPGPYVLGRLGAHVAAPVRVGEQYVVVGWRAGVDGRKLFAGSALYQSDGLPVAFARATWVRLKPAA